MSIEKKNVCVECGIRANYNIVGETFGIRCNAHRHPNMIDIRHAKCITCKVKYPSFDFEGTKTPRYCSDCVDRTIMVDINHPKCISCKKKVPNFDIKGSTKARYCGDCADRNIMININDPRCIKCNKLYPCFNLEGIKKARYCRGCAEPNMINVKDVRCTDNNCNVRASYGIPGLKPTKCAKHKIENMIPKPRSKCKRENCNNNAVYGVKSPIHCEVHKDENEINLTETLCEKCGLLDVCINGLCINICSDSDKIIYEMKRRQKVKELRVFNMLSCEYNKPHEYNLRVSYSCGGKNSEEKEFGYDFGTHKLYIEVDEKQHKRYCELGEINRMKNIYMDDGGIPILFLRYNPDNYQSNGKKQNTPQNKREIELVKWIKYYENIDNIQGFDLSVQYLFYSDGDNSKLHKIEPYE